MVDVTATQRAQALRSLGLIAQQEACKATIAQLRQAKTREAVATTGRASMEILAQLQTV